MIDDFILAVCMGAGMDGVLAWGMALAVIQAIGDWHTREDRHMYSHHRYQ